MDEVVDGWGRGRRREGAGDVADALREDILSLKLKPGAVLSRQALQTSFGVSSTPLRDALMRLQAEGLVEIFPQHATVVTRIDVARATQAQFLRRAVECEAVRVMAEKPDAAVIERLRILIRRQNAFADLADHEAFTQADQEFHRLTYIAAGVPELWTLVRRQSGHIDRLRRLNLPVAGKMREILKAHTAIVDAIEAGDGARAQAALRDHLSKSLTFVDTLRADPPEYFE